MDLIDPPVLPAYREAGQLLVWCDHELRWHQHGGCVAECEWGQAYYVEGKLRAPGHCTCKPGLADGHRFPHCECPNSPYRQTGYSLIESGPFTREVKQRYPRARRAHRCDR